MSSTRHDSLIRDIGTYWFRLPALSKERREAEEEAAAGKRREPEKFSRPIGTRAPGSEPTETLSFN